MCRMVSRTQRPCWHLTWLVTRELCFYRGDAPKLPHCLSLPRGGVPPTLRRVTIGDSASYPQIQTEHCMHLEVATRMGYGHAVVNVYNRVCCHLLLRRPRAALSVAESYWAAIEDQAGSATLWIWQADGSWKLADINDPHRALAELAAGISQMEGWRDQEEKDGMPGLTRGEAEMSSVGANQPSSPYEGRAR